MPTADDYERARALILEFGWNATAYQILNPGLTLWFTARRDGVIGFVRHGRTVVVGGAPVCALDRLDAIAAEFDGAARARGYRVCYFGAGDRLDNLYAADAGWSRVLLGAQPAWDPRSWSDAVGKRQSLRGQFNRARNKGVRVSEWPPDSKKLSLAPIRSTRSIFCHSPANARSVSVSGSMKTVAVAVALSGAGNAFRSTLPLGVSGSRSSVTKSPGTM